MIAAASDFPDKPEGLAQAAFSAAQRGTTPETEPPVEVSEDAEIGREVARQVAARGARSRAESLGLGIDSAVVAMEPEEVGGNGSRLRRCIVTGDIKPHEEMIRFVVSPEGILTPDLEESLPGRGYWVTANYANLHKAVTSDAFQRAVRGPVTLPPALIDQVVVLARRACLATLGLARRAWAVEFGYDYVRQSLVARKAGILILARNAPTEMHHKLDSVKGDVPVVLQFNTAELSAALGRESLAFVSINKGQWTTRLLIECNRLAQLLAR